MQGLSNQGEARRAVWVLALNVEAEIAADNGNQGYLLSHGERGSLGVHWSEWSRQIDHHQNIERHPAPRCRHCSGSGLHPLARAGKALLWNRFRLWTQRPQLWYHLPPIDSFRLYGSIYGLDAATPSRRVDFLVDVFELQRLLHTPVRKLSLGQRMRCEVAVSLLHAPRLVLLDEPAIGLDVVAKQRIRDTSQHMREEEGVGVLLTSHDAGDIEALCERVIVISAGQLVFDDTMSDLKQRYLTSKRVEVRFSTEGTRHLPMPGVESAPVGRYGLELRFDPRVVNMEAVIAGLGNLGTLVDITIADPDMEEVIRTIYAENNHHTDNI